MYRKNSEAILPTLRRTNSREIEYIDTRIVGVDTDECSVYMGERNDTLTVICELINNDDYERLNEYDCEYLQMDGGCKKLGFEIGINTFKDSLYYQLLASVFCIRDMPRKEFEPDKLMYRYVKVAVGVDNGVHLLGFRPYHKLPPGLRF